MRNKVQKNENGVNVLVETKDSNGRHYWHGNFLVSDLKPLSDEEVVKTYRERMSPEDELKAAKDFLKRQDNFAISNVRDEILGIDNNDIVSFVKEK